VFVHFPIAKEHKQDDMNNECTDDLKPRKKDSKSNKDAVDEKNQMIKRKEKVKQAWFF
jgi:hypothetical protein